MQRQAQKNGISFFSLIGSRMPLDLFEFEVRPPFQEKFEARIRSILSRKLAS